MEPLKRPKSYQISTKSLSNIKLSNYKSIISKKLKINPAQSFRNSPTNLFSAKSNNQNKNTSSLTEKKIKTAKNSYFKSSKRYFINADSPKKEENKIELRYSGSANKKSPIDKKKRGKIYIKFIKNYPKTFYQKISNSIQKMKIQTDRILTAMRKNLKISNREVFRRTTSVINIHNINKKKLKQNNLNRDDSKNIEESSIYDNYINIEKALKPSSFSNRLKIKYNIANYLDNDIRFGFGVNRQILGLAKIPSTSFHKVKNKPFYIPLFKQLEINKKKFYKNMYHFRSFDMIDKLLLKNTNNKIYDRDNTLIGLTSYVKEPDIQLKFIFNKIKLILDNIKHFKSNYMIKRDFRLAFINMENPIKAEFNYILEEFCILLIRVIPLILKGFYNSLDQLLFINIPGIDDEMQKKPSNEIECLKYNIKFFNKVTDYFAACVDIFNVIQKQIAEFKYTSSEFLPLNKNLDLARYDSTRLISMADSYIEKAKNDENVFTKFEIGLNLKKKKIQKKEEKINGFERFHKRRRIKVIGEAFKLDRINSALNIAANGMKKDILLEDEKRKKIKLNKNPSILNSDLIKDMMKYFEDNIKAKIISQQVIERFKTKELKRIRNIEDNNNSNNSINENFE